MSDRAFTVRVKLKGILNKKVDSIKISDGLNEIELSPFDYFVIYTDKPLKEPIVKKGR